MTSVVFVHGIGVRDHEYPQALPGLRERLEEVVPQAELRFSFWGGDLGARLPDDADPAEADRPAGSSPWEPAAPDGDRAGADTDALWALLDEDPLFELRLAAGREAQPNRAPHLLPLGRTLKARARELPGDGRLAELLTDAGLAAVFPGAVSAVLGTWVTREALSRATPGTDMPGALARALVAAALASVGPADGVPALTRDTVDQLVAEVTQQLGGSDLGPGARLGRFVVAGLSPLATRRRDALTRGATRYAGDVARYLNPRCGPQIRARIRAEIEAAPPPVVLLGHSLGGVASVDLLAAPDAPAVHALVTVGSQAPYLYRIDALPSLERGKPLPWAFPRWINVHDERDLLSFPAADVFGDRVEDRVVDNGMRSVDLAHRGYFANPQLTSVLQEAFR